MDQIEYDVFISYSRKDYVDENRHVIPGNALSKIKDMLSKNGLTYWFDEDGIYSGQEFTSVITKAIRTSKVFVFVSSKHSNSSAWTSNEIAIAKRLNKPIIPFCLDDSPYNDSVMMLIAALDYIDGSDQNVAFTKLIRSINYYTNKDIKEIDEVSEGHILQNDTSQEQVGFQECKGHASWYEKLVNPSFTFFQKLLVYFQLGAYSLSLLFVIWTSLFGALAVYHHFQLSQLLLMLTLVVALFSTIKLRTGKVFWWAVICICDFLAVLYVSVLAKYLYLYWNSFSSLDMPFSIRYKWLYVMGQEMEYGNYYFMHPTLITVVILHIVLICCSFYKGTRKTIGYVIGGAAILIPLIYFLTSNGITRTGLSRLAEKELETIGSKELSTGKLYGMHEAVDLGLSVKWATCNIGAKEPYQGGGFFAWGEVEEKGYYDWNTYKFGSCSSNDKNLSKYCTDSTYGVVDNLTVLCDSDDAARVLWSEGWRMPTYDEISELKENCTFEKKIYSGVKGVVVTGPNEKKIFFPFVGDIEGDCHIPEGKGTYAILWSSSLYEENDNAYELAFSIADNIWFQGRRFTGHNIRAVHE